MASFKGKAAPSVPVLQDQNGNDFDLSALYGKEALCVFFYPQALTMGQYDEPRGASVRADFGYNVSKYPQRHHAPWTFTQAVRKKHVPFEMSQMSHRSREAIARPRSG